jgi:thiol-disulfide isomerase/thioredoxin
MKRFLIGLTAFCASVAALAQGNITASILNSATSKLGDYGAAPEFTNESWLNTDVPLRLANLRGKVVLLDMWTFGCINCINITPYVQAWHTTYAGQGLVVIGNHFPEFSYERDIANLRAALPKLGITYAITQDNTGDTWSAWANRYWPTIYLIDKQGRVRYTHIGEGGYDTTEAAIQTLLQEPDAPSIEATAEPESVRQYLNTTTTVNVRTGAGTDAAVIGSIEPNEAYVIHSLENDWYQIAYNDGTGFVSAEWVTVKDEAVGVSGS